MENYVFDNREYNKKIKKGNKLFIPFLILIIIILVCSVIYLKPKTVKNELYFLEIKSFLNYQEASNLAVEIQSSQGGGYVYYDGRYHVFACLYFSESDANKVKENLIAQYPACSIYTLEIEKFNSKNYDSSEQSIIENVIENNYKVINDLYDLTMSYDKSEISDSKLSILMNEILSDYNQSFESFKNKFSTKQSARITKALSSLIDIYESLDYLNESIDSQNKSALLKYYLIKIAFLHSSFVSSL